MRYGYVINITAVDRPGIVAAASAALGKFNGNIISCSQTVLDGYFTLIMTFSIPEFIEPEELRTRVLEEKGLQGCQVVLFASSNDNRREEGENPNIYVVTAFGQDSEGIVERFTRYLGDREINIIDLYGNITDDGNFVLIGQVEVDPKMDVQNIQYDLEALGEQLNFTVKIQHNNIFVATNQLRFER